MAKVVITILITGSLTYGYTQKQTSDGVCKEMSKVHTDMEIILERLKGYDDRMKSLENGGSIPLQRHESKDDERVAQLSQRITDVRTDFGQRIQNITSLLEKLITQQTELLAYLKAKESK